jgi:hypothetical protein
MDFHFLIRNGIVGFIFLTTFFGTVALFDSQLAQQLTQSGKDMAALITFGLAPLLGMLIQSLYLIVSELVGRAVPYIGLFNDAARWTVTHRVKGHLAPVQAWDTERQRAMDRFQARVHPDQIFVAVYHTKAPVQLIEWARRRRTYYYLGATGMMAFALGALSGFAFVPYRRCTVLGDPVSGMPIASAGTVCTSFTDYAATLLSRDTHATPLQIALVVLAMLGGLLFLIGIFWLTRRMKRDADGMELAWSLMETDTQARQALLAPNAPK